MQDFEDRSKWTKAPILALLAAGLMTGGAVEVLSHSDGGIPDAPPPIAAPAVEIPEAPPEAPELIPPPPAEPETRERDISSAPTFTPFSVAPSITNRDEVIAAMEAAYPAELRDEGIGGTVRVYFFIDDEGDVQDVRIDQSSGNKALDEAAMSVANVYRFTPARNNRVAVPVWVSFPITFQVR